jgi:S1-C subfamily serine protease
MYRKSFIISFLIFLVATVAPSRIVASAEFVDLARAAKPAVVLLLCLDGNGHEVGSGSGFFVSTDGRLVTNFHVVEDAERMEAELMDGRRIPIVGLLAKDITNDIAILQADFKPSPSETLPLAKVEFGNITECFERSLESEPLLNPTLPQMAAFWQSLREHDIP